MHMQQQISLVTLGVSDMARSRRFYADGFGWQPVFETGDIVFFQMNGFVFGIWPNAMLADDMGRRSSQPSGGFALAHNVPSRDDVTETMTHLTQYGATILREADAPPWGGLRGYIADPDGHPWEIAWNPAWPISADGHVTFSA
jgi:catechol 2,3-dioxygenase-like lactoylglutathione lyase family enzyme